MARPICPRPGTMRLSDAGNYYEIPLGRGAVALVDEGDYGSVSSYRWYLKHGSATYYAYSSEPGSSGAVRVRMHNLIMLPPVGLVVDHIDGNGLDNRRANLRLATRSQNSRNSQLQRSKPVRLKGISLKRDRQWQARITLSGQSLYLGCFESAEEAARAYDTAARQHFGEFARVNFL